MPDSCVKRQALIEAPSSISLIFSSRAHQSRLLESKVLFSQPQVPCGDHVQRVLDGFQLDRAKSRLGDFQRDTYAERDGLEGIEPPSVARDRVERSVLRPSRGLDHDHNLYRGIIRDLGRGLGH